MEKENLNDDKEFLAKVEKRLEDLTKKSYNVGFKDGKEKGYWIGFCAAYGCSIVGIIIGNVVSSYLKKD